MGRCIEKFRLIVKSTEQANGNLRWLDLWWLGENLSEFYREVEALERLSMPLEQYERIANSLFMQMDAMLAKASPMIKEEIARLRDRIATLEAENATIKKGIPDVIAQ